MENPLFSTYSQGENQVTGTIISLLQHISSQLAEDILESMTDESDLSLVSFENQVPGEGSVPDAGITSSSALLIETKISRDSVRKKQLKNHLKKLDEYDAEIERLILLTPDAEKPAQVKSIEDQRLVWSNFDTLVGSIESILERDRGNAELGESLPTEREAYILRELERFLYDQSNLVGGKEDRVLVVAARKAWPEFKENNLYFCQPNRSFKPSSHLAFYTDGEIKTSVPQISEKVESIEITERSVRENDEISEKFKEELISAIENMGKEHYRYGKNQKVMLLQEDLELEESIINDKTASGSDRKVAFVQGHRYVSLQELRENPHTTTSLED